MTRYTIAGYEFELSQCPVCAVWYLFPAVLDDKMMEQRGPCGKKTYCPNGHSWHYTGETEADKLRRERDRLKQDIARAEDEAREAKAAAKREIRRMKRRASAGLCPCCQRTFSNMAVHMRKQHPQFVKQNALKVVT